MVVWQGRGILVPLSFVGFVFLNTMLFTDTKTPLVQTVVPGLAFIMTGIISYLLGKKWRQEQGHIVIDKATNQEIELKAKHTFFWIDVFYWSFICIALGIISLISLLF